MQQQHQQQVNSIFLSKTTTTKQLWKLCEYFNTIKSHRMEICPNVPTKNHSYYQIHNYWTYFGYLEWLKYSLYNSHKWEL